MKLMNATWRWPDGATLGPTELVLRTGERVVITGVSGSGKSTILRRMAGLLSRHAVGTAEGEATVAGVSPADLAPAARAQLVGFVPQDPGDQVVTGTVRDEVSFGLELIAVDHLDDRTDRALAAVGLTVDASRDPRTLSGGQLQRLAVASSAAVSPDWLLLDEPLAWLDTAGSRDVLQALAALPCTIVIAEHRLEACWSWADRIVLLEDGQVIADGPPSNDMLETLRGHGLAVPALRSFQALAPPQPHPGPVRSSTTGPVVLAVHDLHWSWGEVPALRGVTLEVQRGERIALVGPNGAGKSTLLDALSGQIGERVVEGRTVAVPQDPDLALFARTVQEELAFGPREHGLPLELDATLRTLRLQTVADHPPHALSRGQRLRLATAAAWVTQPAVLLLDEPTAGQDRSAVEAMWRALHHFKGAVVFATHDVGLALRWADRIVHMQAGRIVPEPPPLPPLATWCEEHGVDYVWADRLAHGES